MREAITIERNGKPVVIGYASMMAPTGTYETNKVFKMLRLNADIGQEGSIFFFKNVAVNNVAPEWVLSTEHSYINLEGPERLIDLFQTLPRNKGVTWDDFIFLIIQAYNDNY